MRKNIVQLFKMALGFIFVFSNVFFAGAQDTGTEEFTLEEITVTAQKREENQQKVPMAVEVITGEELKELGKNDLDQILSNISGAIINKASDGLRVSLRGVSEDNSTMNDYSTPAVAVNKDGVYTNRKTSSVGLFDVERVEVLYGPQSTLYSSATPGGVVNIITADPKTDKFEGSGMLEYGNYDYVHTEGTINVPITESVALRAAFSTSVRDGYLSNGADNEDSKYVRLKALYKPNENFSFLITGEYQSAVRGFASVVTFADQDDRDDPWTTTSSETFESPTPSKQKKVYGRIDWNLGFGSLSIVPSYAPRSTHSVSVDDSDVTTVSDGEAVEKGMEIRMTSSEDFFFKWIGGFNWYKSTNSSNSVSSSGSYSTSGNSQKSTALYGNITYPILNQFRVTGGLRKSWDTNNSLNIMFPNRDPSDPNPLYEVVEMEYSNPDTKIGFEYDVSDNSMLYADWSTSYRTQGMALDANDEPFPPEKLKAYTLGSKNRFLGNKIQVNGAAYYYKYEDYFAADMIQTVSRKDVNGDGDYDDTNVYDEDTGGYRNETLMMPDENAKTVGDANLIGVDLDTSFIITSQDMLDISVSYEKAEFTKLYFDFWDITNEIGIPDQDCEGYPFTFSPNWTVNGTYSHNFHLQNGDTITARLESRYQSEYVMTWNNKSISLDANYEPVVTYIDAIRTQEPYHISNIYATYLPSNGKYTLTGYVKNLENYAVKRSYMNNSLMIGSPRTYGAVLSVRF